MSRDRLRQVAYGLRAGALFDLLRKGVDRVEPNSSACDPHNYPAGIIGMPGWLRSEQMPEGLNG